MQPGGQPADALGQVREGLDHAVRGDVAQAEAAQARRVDDPAAAGQPQRDRRRRGVPPRPVTALTVPTARPGVRDQRVDQGGLAHAGVADAAR